MGDLDEANRFRATIGEPPWTVEEYEANLARGLANERAARAKHKAAAAEFVANDQDHARLAKEDLAEGFAKIAQVNATLAVAHALREILAELRKDQHG